MSEIEHGELVTPAEAPEESTPDTESVQSPAKVMRIGTMVKQLLDEVRAAPLDDRSRERLTDIYQKSVHELSEALSPDLQAELQGFALRSTNGGRARRAAGRPRRSSSAWLEDLFHGIQATPVRRAARRTARAAPADRAGARAQLPPGAMPGRRPDGERPGTYL